MDAVPGYRACYQCPCGAYRWQRSAAQKGETHCQRCGTPFTGAQLRYWPKPKKAGGRGRMQPATSQPSSGQWPQQNWPLPGSNAKGEKGKGAKGNQAGPGGKGRRPPQQPGLLTSSPAAPGNGRTAAGAAQPSPSGINYNRASKDALYKARTHYDVVRGFWGEEHAYTAAAKQGLAEAEREALQTQPPAKKLAALRQEHGRVLDSIHHGLQRSDEIEATMLALQREYYDLETAVEARARRAEELQAEVDAQEADLPAPAEPGAQRGLRDQLQQMLQTHIRRSGKEFKDGQQQRVVDNLDELLRDFEEPEDEHMGDDDLDSLPDLSDAEARAERAPKQRRERDRDPQAQDAEAGDDGDWQKGFGAVGKKLARRGVLAKRTVQQLDARQAGQGGKAKGKGTGKGKGKAVSYSAAVQSHAPPTATYTSAAAASVGGAPGAPTASATGLPSAAVPPGGVPAGGSLTGGWPQLGVAAATCAPAAPAPVPAMDFCAHQAQLRRGEGTT